jgi:hypothetical protein
MATKILSVVENHHLFLVTLLIANAIALESLPLARNHNIIGLGADRRRNNPSSFLHGPS